MNGTSELDDVRVGHGSERGVPAVVALDGAAATVGLDHPFPLVVEVAILALSFRLVTVVGGVARQVIVRLFDGTGTPVFSVVAPGTQNASLSVSYSFAPDLTAAGSAAAGFMTAPFLGARLPANLSLFVGVIDPAAGDVIEIPRLLVRQWPANRDALGGSASG